MPREKAANKSGDKSEDRRLSPSDPLRAYEQFGRIDILEGGLAGSPFVDVNVLANLAQQQLDSGHAENAANLLRAAEHLSFAALAPKDSARLTSHIPGELKAAVAAELDRLSHAARDLWSESGDPCGRTVIEPIYVTALDRRPAGVRPRSVSPRSSIRPRGRSAGPCQ